MKKILLFLALLVTFLSVSNLAEASTKKYMLKSYELYEENTLYEGEFYAVNFLALDLSDIEPDRLRAFAENGIMHYDLITKESIDSIMSDIGLTINEEFKSILLNPDENPKGYSYYFIFHIDKELSFVEDDSFYGTIYKMIVDEAPNITDPKIHLLNYDDKITLDMIKSRYEASDNYDGPLTEEIKFETNYPSNYDEVKIGSYYITASVSDSSGNKTTVTNEIKVVDITKPVFSGKTSYILEYGSSFTIEEILNNLNCNDNYEKNISSDKWKIEDDKKIDLECLDPQEFIIYYVDGSGNKGEITVTVDINDTESPIITINDLVEVSSSNPLSKEEIINLLINSKYIPNEYKNVEIESKYFLENKPGETYDALVKMTNNDDLITYYRLEIGVVDNKITNNDDNKLLFLVCSLIVIGFTGGIIIFVKRKKAL